jgi:diphthamide biosynthesis protein 2
MHYSLRLNVARNVLQYYFNSATKLSPAALTSRLMQGVKIASDGTEVLSSGLEGLEACGRDLYTVDEFYEVERTARWIGRGGFKRVALQFPDELLRDSAAVSWRVLEKIGAEEGQEVRLFITGDTSYGSCCVDEVAAQHYAAEAIVHFGRACLSPTAASIPVLYVFGRRKLDTAQCAQALASAARTVPMGSKVLVLYDVMYLHSIPDILEAMRDAQESDLQNRLIVGYPRPQEGHSVTVSDESGGSGHQHQQECGGIAIAGLRVDGISCEDDLNTTAMFFIGQEGRQLSNALMRCGGCVMKFSYDPERPLDLRVRDESAGGNRDLMRRYYLIQKAKDAEIIGIVVGTLGVREYDVVLSSVRTALAESGRKSYTFAVGKVNPAKLANFAEVSGDPFAGWPRPCPHRPH